MGIKASGMCKGSLNFTSAVSAGILGCELFLLPSVQFINGLADNYLYKGSCSKQLEHSTVWWIPRSRIQPLLPHTLGLPWKAVPGPPPTGSAWLTLTGKSVHEHSSCQALPHSNYFTTWETFGETNLRSWDHSHRGVWLLTGFTSQTQSCSEGRAALLEPFSFLMFHHRKHRQNWQSCGVLSGGGSIEVSFLALSPNVIIPTRKAAQQGCPALQACL